MNDSIQDRDLAQPEAQACALAAGAKPPRWILLSGASAQEAVARGGELGDLIESSQLTREDELGKKLRLEVEELASQRGAPGIALETQTKGWNRVQTESGPKTVETTQIAKQWAVFLADQESGLVFAFIGRRVGEEERLPSGSEATLEGVRLFATRVSSQGEPFDSIRAVRRIDGGFGSLSELAAAIDEHGSLGFAHAAWESEQLRDGLGMPGEAERKKAPRL